MSNQAWICPRCNRANAGWLPFCNCHMTQSTKVQSIKTQTTGLTQCDKCEQYYYVGSLHDCKNTGALDLRCGSCGEIISNGLHSCKGMNFT